MSSNLKKELREALDILEQDQVKTENKELKEIRALGKKNRAIRSQYNIKGWCFAGDHPIIDIEGGE